MKKRLYKVVYSGKEIYVLAVCDEDAYWTVLARHGIEPIGDVDMIVVNNKMDIYLS